MTTTELQQAKDQKHSVKTPQGLATIEEVGQRFTVIRVQGKATAFANDRLQFAAGHSPEAIAEFKRIAAIPTARYLTCAETAKLVRKTLKAEFPGIKFSVRSKTYAGGASIRVSWTDGPTTKQVDEVVSIYASKSFDGNIDMGCYWDCWLLPDGSITWAKGSGTTGSRGYIEAIDRPKPHPDAELVHFGSNYVSTSREFSVGFLTALAEKVSKEHGLPAPKVIPSKWGGAYLAREEFTRVSGPYTLNDLIYRAA